MRQLIIIFISAFLVAFIGGYFIYGGLNSSNGVTEAQPNVEQNSGQDGAGKTEETPNTTAMDRDEGDILSKQGCIACHAISSLNLEGGATGPDLSKAYTNMEGKHGVTLDEFLQNPTSAVMSSVIGSNPLSDEVLEQIVEALRIAAEK